MLTSTTCWVMKTIVAIVNLGIFGIGSSNYKSYALSEGFWCAAFSAGLAALISLVLVFYAIFSEATEDTEDKSLRIQARHFLLTELSFFCVIALEALIMSRLEGWAFFDAVYFAVITGRCALPTGNLFLTLLYRISYYRWVRIGLRPHDHRKQNYHISFCSYYHRRTSHTSQHRHRFLLFPSTSTQSSLATPVRAEERG